MGSSCSMRAFLKIGSSPLSPSFSKCPASVIFLIYRTLYPRCFKYLNTRSNDRKVRQFPKCTLLYTVGPQTYMPTAPSCIGVNFSFVLVSELYMCKSCCFKTSSFRLGICYLLFGTSTSLGNLYL